jgi:hypothetical protein
VPLAVTLFGVFSKRCRQSLGYAPESCQSSEHLQRKRSEASATVRLCLMATTGLIPRWWNVQHGFTNNRRSPWWLRSIPFIAFTRSRTAGLESLHVIGHRLG